MWSWVLYMHLRSADPFRRLTCIVSAVAHSKALSSGSGNEVSLYCKFLYVCVSACLRINLYFSYSTQPSSKSSHLESRHHFPTFRYLMKFASYFSTKAVAHKLASKIAQVCIFTCGAQTRTKTDSGFVCQWLFTSGGLCHMSVCD